MSSTFWLKNLSNTVKYVDETGKLITEHHRQELDIIETIGTPTRFPNWNKQFNANTHYQVRVEGGGDPLQLDVPVKGGAKPRRVCRRRETAALPSNFCENGRFPFA